MEWILFDLLLPSLFSSPVPRFLLTHPCTWDDDILECTRGEKAVEYISGDPRQEGGGEEGGMERRNTTQQLKEFVGRFDLNSPSLNIKRETSLTHKERIRLALDWKVHEMG